MVNIQYPVNDGVIVFAEWKPTDQLGLIRASRYTTPFYYSATPKGKEAPDAERITAGSCTGSERGVLF